MTENKNPFLKPYNTPHDTAPFHLIKIEHYEPALLEGMKEQNEEIDAIVNNPEAPTFQNTIVALEKSGALLDLSLIHISEPTCPYCPNTATTSV